MFHFWIKFPIIKKVLPLTILFFCCAKEANVIPDIPVYLEIYLSDPNYQSLQIEGNSLQILKDQYGDAIGNQGNGLIIYRNSQNEFSAYDRTCPYDWKKGKNIAVDVSGGAIATCPECKSTYILTTFGYPTDAGPATAALKEYRTSFFVNTNKLLVSN